MVEEAEGIENNYIEEYFRQLKNLRAQYPNYHPAVIHIIATEKTQETMKKRTNDHLHQYYNISIYQTPIYPP